MVNGKPLQLMCYQILLGNSLNSHACLSSFFMQYPDGESDSPFVLLTDNPLHLTVKLKVSGKHKIC